MENVNSTKELLNFIKRYIKIGINIIFIFILSYILSYIVNTYLFFVEECSVKDFVLFLQDIQEEINVFVIFDILYKRFSYEVFQIFRLLFITFFIGIYYLKCNQKSLIESFHKYRYVICVFVFLICLIFEFNGSSIGIYESSLNKTKKDNGVLFGISRNIRADEFSVNTPMALSQVNTGFKFENDAYRATSTNMFIIYGQPVWDISMIFRFFQIGYLIFGSGRGLAFFWSLRIIALFIISYEFGLFVFNKNKKLSLTYSILVFLSPVIQWWFAINGLVEMIIFAELGIIVLKKFLLEEKTIKKVFELCLLWICVGTFLLTFYPAWMIPCFYIFLPIVIWVILDNRKEVKFNIFNIILCVIVSVIFVMLIGRVFIKSYDVIALSMNTVYPGNRLSQGGEDGNIKLYLNQFFNIFLPTCREIDNECETSLFIDFSYLTIFIVLYLIFKEKYFKDKLVNLILFFEVFLNTYIILGFPEIISKVTLMNYTMSLRVIQVLGILNLILLFRILSIDELKDELKFKNRTTIFISLIITTIIVVLLMLNYRDFFNVVRLIIIGLICFTSCISILKRKYNLLIYTSIVLVFFSSMFVNPLRIGCDIITDVETFNNLVKLDNEDTGVWMLEEIKHPIPKNLFPMNGLKTINSVNVYPNIELWKRIDKDGKYEDVYNRYAHIQMYIDNTTKSAEFSLQRPDSFCVKITEDDLKALGIKYVVRNVLEDELVLNNGVLVEEIYKDELFKVYKLKY